jgi:hypothetical protein
MGVRSSPSENQRAAAIGAVVAVFGVDVEAEVADADLGVDDGQVMPSASARTSMFRRARA